MNQEDLTFAALIAAFSEWPEQGEAIPEDFFSDVEMLELFEALDALGADERASATNEEESE